MNSDKKVTHIEPPQPGKTIVFLEGEILSVTLNQWGYIGRLKTEFGEYNYKLKDSISTTNDIMIGLKLIITNGYCYENKKKEIVVSDGKFGKINTEIDVNYIKQLNQEHKVIVGIIEDKAQKDSTIQLLIKIPFPPFDEYKIIVNKQNQDEIMDFFLNKLVVIEGTGNLESFSLLKLELLNENHYLKKLIELKQGKSQNVSYFSKIIISQINFIEHFHTSFKDIFFNMKGKVSKTLLDNLKDLLLSKILDGEINYPYNILISKKDIETYFDSMINFTRDIIYENTNISNPEDLISYLRYYYPSFKIEN